MMFKKLKNAKGFTLVELMIVVAIIGILAALAIPAFSRFLKSSKAGEADLLMKKVTDGAKAYYTSEQKRSPATGREPWHIGNATPGQDDSHGMPMDRDVYVFPGGTDVAALNMLLYTAAALGCADAPDGGVKAIPDQTAANGLTGAAAATLNLLAGVMVDPSYVGIDYAQTGVGLDAVATVRAQADFDEDDVCHTSTIQVSVDDDTREVLVAPAYIENNLE